MPEFENENDRRNQKEIADFIARRYPLRYDGYIFLSAMLYRLDGVLYKEDGGMRKPKLFFEVKQRTVPFRHYENYLISSSKLIAARDLHHIAPAALFVRFADGVIAGVNLAKHDGQSFVIGGRPPRPGSVDIEPMAVFHWDQFKVIHDPRPNGGA